MKHRNEGNIYLTGFMGSGKSTVGILLAKRLKRAFLDTDEWIEHEMAKSIADIFYEHGEKFFREKETECVRKISHINRMVVALGGGAVLSADNWMRIKQTGIVIYLKCTPEQIWERVKDDDTRPLLYGKTNEQRRQAIDDLMKEREPFYQCADIIIEYQDQESVDMIVDKIMLHLEGKV